MKKLIVLLFVSFSMYFYANAQPPELPSCPTGFSQFQTTVQVGNCNYTVWFCYKCEFFNQTGGTQYKVTYDVQMFVPNSNSCKKADYLVMHAIEEKLTDPTFIENILCDVGDVPFCDDPLNYFLVTVESAMCWYKYFDPEYGDFGAVFYAKCDDDAYCKRTWKICWDGDDYIYSFYSGPTVFDGPADCDEDEPDDPTLLNPITDCYQICNPCTCPENY